MLSEIEQYGYVLRGIVFAFAGYSAWRFLLQPSLVENFRQKMFAHRRRLFLLGLEGKVSREDPGFVRLYDCLNFMIRYADRITFVRLVIISVTYGKDRGNITEYNNSKVINEIRQEITKDFSLHIIISSIPMIFIALAIGIISLFWNGVRGVFLRKAQIITDQMKEDCQMFSLT